MIRKCKQLILCDCLLCSPAVPFTTGDNSGGGDGGGSGGSGGSDVHPTAANLTGYKWLYSQCAFISLYFH